VEIFTVGLVELLQAKVGIFKDKVEAKQK